MTTLLRIGDLRSQIQTTPTELIPRHKGDGRPRIFPEGGGKGEFYTRTTTFIDCLDDKSSLTNWKLQTAMAGLQRKPELLDKYDPEGSWTQKNNVVESILRAGGASEKADIGTALHEVTEAIDNGREPPMVPPDLQADVDAYRRIREELNLTWSAAELFGVNDHYKVAGTMDRVGYIDGKGPVVMDVKTSGTLDYSFGKFTMQVALYAMFSLYDPVSYRRSPLVFDGKPLDQDVGYILWLPQGKGHCEVVPVDLAAGRRYIELAASVREYRRWAARKSTKAPSIASVTI